MATLQPIKAVKCTYKDCAASFDTVRHMKSHKKHAPEHDYCEKCDEDFEDYEQLAQHKAFRPDNHGLACRICGDEFRSKAGLKSHIEKTHRVNQRLPCLGCKEQFHSASLLVQHLEFGECPKISALEFRGQIVHKFLITEILKSGPNHQRFKQKISMHDAAEDDDEGGGVTLMDNSDYEARAIDYPVIQPELNDTPITNPAAQGPYPPLPSSSKGKSNARDTDSELSYGMRSVSLGLESESGATSTTAGGTSTAGGKSTSTSRPVKAWGSGKTTSNLFPKAQSVSAQSVASSAAPSVWSIEQHDQQQAGNQINIMTTRFWDPVGPDWNAELFYDPIVNQYYCPFVCEQHYDVIGDLTRHIMHDHRISRMRCPQCLKLFPSCTALVAHCETGSKRCRIKECDDFATFLDRLTGGFLDAQEEIRPDHAHNPTVWVMNRKTGRKEKFTPPTATYMQYSVTKPSTWQEKEKTITIGGFPQQQK